MQDIPVDLPDALWLQNYFAHYANPKARIERLVRQGLLFRLKRGLYIRPEAANDEYVLGKAANRLYGPSYVSFLYAMRWYGMIPEHVAHITSATFKKGKTKRYDTPVGSFFYRDIPSRAFPYGITFVGEGQSRFLIASAEKALCDELYRASGIRSIGKMETLLFEDLRLDQSWFKGIDHNMLISLATKYCTVTLNTFSKFITKLANHA
jgi:predicted transcriptional regulator of viral defense system